MRLWYGWIGSVALFTNIALATPPVNVRHFDAPMSERSGVSFEPAQTPDPFDWNASLWMTYAYKPITLRNEESADVVQEIVSHQWAGDLAFSMGLGKKLSVGVSLPMLFAQTGDTLTEESKSYVGEGNLASQAIGDLVLGTKYTLVNPTKADLGGFALGLLNRLQLPTGSTSSFMAEGLVADELRVLAEYRLVAVGFYGNIGFKVRTEEVAFPCVENTDCNARFGNELPFGIALALKPQALGIDPQGHWLWFIENRGALPVSPISPFESADPSFDDANVGARYSWRDFSVLGAVETSIVQGIGATPIRAIGSLTWAPRVYDVDKDDVEDERDQCRELPEDRDGFEDTDGCPDADNDDDGVLDTDDKCPREKEDEDEFEDEDGCVDPDNDRDGIPDALDACPGEVGARNINRSWNGCAWKDTDGDKVGDDADACVDVAEDYDGYEDTDGCPDVDNDKDGIIDTEDACPVAKGIAQFLKNENGCPDVDIDHDTFLNTQDQCPNEAETFDGVQDDDGCPEKKSTKPLSFTATRKGITFVEFEKNILFEKDNTVSAKSILVIRSVAQQLMAHPEWSVGIAVQGSHGSERAFAMIQELVRYARRGGIETVGWPSMKESVSARRFGVGIQVLNIEAK